MNYKCNECEEPRGIPIFAETNLVYARVSNPSLSQNPPAYNHPGHVLVLPKRHVENRIHLTPPEILDLDELTNDVADVVKHVFRYDSVNIMEIDGQRSVKHLHKHVVPADEPYAIPMNFTKLDSAQVLELTELLKQAF